MVRPARTSSVVRVRPGRSARRRRKALPGPPPPAIASAASPPRHGPLRRSALPLAPRHAAPPPVQFLESVLAERSEM